MGFNLGNAVIGGVLGDPSGGILSGLAGGGGGGSKQDTSVHPVSSVDGKLLSTPAQAIIDQKSKFVAPLYDPTKDPATSAFFAPYLMYNPGTIKGTTYDNSGQPQLGTYDPLGMGIYQSELQDKINKARNKAKGKGMFASIGSTIGAIAGGIGGFAIGGPLGAMEGVGAGAAIGGSLGGSAYDISQGNFTPADLAGVVAGAGAFDAIGKPKPPGAYQGGIAALGAQLGIGGGTTETASGGSTTVLDSGGDVVNSSPNVSWDALGNVITPAISTPANSSSVPTANQAIVPATQAPAAKPLAQTAYDALIQGYNTVTSGTPLNPTPTGEALPGSLKATTAQAKTASVATPTAATNQNPKVAKMAALPPRDTKKEAATFLDNPKSLPLINMVEDFSKANGRKSELIHAMQIQESSGNPNAVSPDGGAIGLFQIRAPAYADVFGKGRNYQLTAEDKQFLLDPRANLAVMTKYMDKQHNDYGAQSDAEALAGFYGGPQMIKKYRDGTAPKPVYDYVNQVSSRAEFLGRSIMKRQLATATAARVIAGSGYGLPGVW